MLIVDQCEKAAVASKRKAEAKHIVVSVPRKYLVDVLAALNIRCMSILSGKNNSRSLITSAVRRAFIFYIKAASID